jgi:hypothetical protein
MKHFLITRFNDYFPTFDSIGLDVKNNDLGVDGFWLRKRMEIFQEFTVPCVESQTDKDFIWICKCHPKTPDWVKKILKNLNLIASYEEIDYKKTTSIQAEFAFESVIKNITNDKEIITSRLDSDDGISKDYIKITKMSIKEGQFFDFTKGIVRNSNGLFFHEKKLTSQFCSYMEKKGELKTVYHQFHHLVQNPIKNQVDFGWLQNNHEINITTNLRNNLNRVYPNKASFLDYSNILDSYPSLKKIWLYEKNHTVKYSF